MSTQPANWEVPAGIARRGLWISTRLLAWLSLFLVLQVIGALVMQWVPFSFEGPASLLPSATSLLAALLAAFALLHWLDHRPARSLGFDLNASAAALFAVGTAIGAGVLLAIAAFELLAGWLAFRPDPGTLSAWLVTVMRDFALLGIAAAAEEAMFRGYAFQILVAGIGAPIATVVCSLLFAWAHSRNPNVGNFAFLNIFLAGVMLSIAWIVTRSLWFATAIHVGWNWSMASLLDLPVSGLEIFDTPLYEPALDGPVWFTGGLFGPEGGLAGTIGFGAALFAILWARGAMRRWAVRPAAAAEG